MTKRNILLNPGPATTTESVKMAQVVPDICHREAEFGELMEEVSTELTSIVADPKHYTAVLFGGSGTAGMESMIVSVAGLDDGLLIINNGAYGNRMCQICEAYGIRYYNYESSKIAPIDMQALERFIEEHHNSIKHMICVHHETTSGLLNDIQALGDLALKYQLTFMVDAVSSYAAIPIDMKQMHIHYLISTSNKNIQGMAGIVFVIGENAKLEELKDQKPKCYYLDLYGQYVTYVKTKAMRFTPPVQTMYALRQAILELKEETVEGRYQRYTKSWKTLLAGLKRLGFVYLVEDQYQSHLLTTVMEPDLPGYSFDSMHDYLYERDFTIYPGKIGEKDTFRIANIGAIDHQDIESFLIALESYLNQL